MKLIGDGCYKYYSNDTPLIQSVYEQMNLFYDYGLDDDQLFEMSENGKFPLSFAIECEN